MNKLKALYFPYARIENIKTLNNAVLLFDEINIINPDSFISNYMGDIDSHSQTVKRHLESLKLLRDEEVVKLIDPSTVIPKLGESITEGVVEDLFNDDFMKSCIPYAETTWTLSARKLPQNYDNWLRNLFRNLPEMARDQLLTMKWGGTGNADFLYKEICFATEVQFNPEAAKDFYRTNVIGTENVIQACRANAIPKLVYTSTPSVVFDARDICGADETKPYSNKFHGNYAKTKTIAEQMVLHANDEKLSTVALRPHQIIGPDDPHLVPRLVYAAKQGRLKIVGTGRNLVDVTYVQNAVDAHLQAFDKLAPGSAVAGQAYFIGQEKPVVLWDFINEILSRHHLPPITDKVPAWVAFNIGLLFEYWYKFFRIDGEPPMTRFVALQFSRSHYFSHQKAKNDFGYEPKISIEQALDLMMR